MVHEAGHIRYTDMQCWKNRDPSPLLRSLANAIEDSRIERLMIKKYAGAQYLLRCAHDPCLEEYLKPAYKPNEASALGLYCITATSAMFRDGLAVKVRDVMRGWCVRYFGERTTAAVDAELSNFFKFKSVYDVIACSERIISLLKNVRFVVKTSDRRRVKVIRQPVKRMQRSETMTPKPQRKLIRPLRKPRQLLWTQNLKRLTHPTCRKMVRKNFRTLQI